MKIIAVLAAVMFLALNSVVPTFAVDKTISPLCRVGADTRYSRAGGFCEQVAANVSIVATGDARHCPAGYVPNPDQSETCIPIPN